MTTRHLAKGSRMPSPPQKGILRLYSNRFCPYAQRIHLVLDAKKIPYDIVNINLSHKPDWIYNKNPSGKIPALEVDGEVIYESLIIADYLDEKYPQNPLYPKDPLKKAKDRLLIEQFSKVTSTMYKILTNYTVSCMDEYMQTIQEGLEAFENELNLRKGPFYGGQKPNMLDYMIWPWCERSDLLKLFGKQFLLRKDRFKKLMEWRTNMQEDTAVQKSFLDTDTHIKYLQSYRSGISECDLILSE